MEKNKKTKNRKTNKLKLNLQLHLLFIICVSLRTDSLIKPRDRPRCSPIASFEIPRLKSDRFHGQAVEVCSLRHPHAGTKAPPPIKNLWWRESAAMLISQPKLNQDYPRGVVYLGDIRPQYLDRRPNMSIFDCNYCSEVTLSQRRNVLMGPRGGAERLGGRSSWQRDHEEVGTKWRKAEHVGNSDGLR